MNNPIQKILKIARREYMEALKTRTFLIGVIVTPLLIIGLAVISGKMARDVGSGPQPPRSVGVVDRSGRLAGDVEAAFARYNKARPQRPLRLVAVGDAATAPEQRVERLKADVKAGRIEAGLVVAPVAAEEPPAGEAGPAAGPAPRLPVEPSRYYANTKSVNDLELYETVRRLLNEAVINRRYAAHDLSPELIARITRPVPLEQVEISQKQPGRGQASMARIMVPFFFMFLMFMGITTTSQGLLTSVVEEKSSRVIEVLLAVVSPFELMAGKVLGLAGVGLSLIAIWGVTGLGSARFLGMGSLLTGAMPAWFIIYYVLGFMLIASLFAAIGSACNTLKEAQNLLGPVTVLIVLPMVLWMPISQNPMGTLATVFAFFPPTTAMIMILRLSVNPGLPVAQIAGSILALAVASVATMWAAGKIFSLGILMYGKPPTPRELLRWVRYR
ncbi:MAG: ABC transporter permease [bacterium]|nr:ABC transporter permease [bacterium]